MHSDTVSIMDILFMHKIESRLKSEYLKVNSQRDVAEEWYIDLVTFLDFLFLLVSTITISVV